jgi:hypothetical protein
MIRRGLCGQLHVQTIGALLELQSGVAAQKSNGLHRLATLRQRK